MESSGRLEIISNNRIRPIERDNNQSSRQLRVEKKTAIFRKSKNREREKEREREGTRGYGGCERAREREKRRKENVACGTARTHARTQRHAHMPLACSGSHKVAPHVVLSLLYISRPTRSRPLVRPCVTTIRETAMT